MAYEQKDGSGALFKNDQKDSEMHPDYKGTIMVGRTEYWLSAWIKESKKGVMYMSLSSQPKRAKQIPGAMANKAPAKDFDDEWPM